VESMEVFEYRKQYTRLLGSIGHKIKRANEDRVKTEVLREYFTHLDLYSSEYKSIESVYRELGQMDRVDVTKRVARLKGVEKNTKALGRVQHKR